MKRQTTSSKKGVALIEAAFTIPLLLMLFLGILFGSLGFTSYAMTSLDVVAAYVAMDAFDYKGSLKSKIIVHGHPADAYLNIAETDEKGLVFANLVSGRAQNRRDPFGTPTDDQLGKYAFSSASKVPYTPSNGHDQVYTVDRTFIPWIRGLESVAVKSSLIGAE